jgi:hypothetical protein
MVAMKRQPGIEDKKIWKLELGPCNAPDGEYVLNYFLSKDHSEYVRVENGVCWHTRT